jgi:translation initiation factor IF-2
LSSKRRVFQVAREFNVSIEALTVFLNELKFQVGSRMSQVTEEMYEEVRKEFSQDMKVATDDYDIKRELKEKKAVEAEKKKKELIEFEKRVEISTKVMSESIERRKKAAEEKVASKRVRKTKAEDEDLGKAKEKAEKEKIETKEVDVTKGEATSQKERTNVEKNDEKIPVLSTAEKEGEKKDEGAKRVIRKIDDKKKAKQVETSEESKDDKPKEKRKKLKKKERLAQTKEEKSKEAEEAPRKKLKKRKKKDDLKTDDKVKTKSRKKLKKKKKFIISEEEVTESIKQTFAAMEDVGKSKKRKKKLKDDDDDFEEEENVLHINEFLSVGELAQAMDEESSEVIKKCMELGLLVTINMRLDKETIEIISDEYGFQIEFEQEFGTEILTEIEEEAEDEEKLQPRSPVITIMGHVDHGKTSLLDYIRSSKIMDGEAGGITQHIGAYKVEVGDKSITFLDTPGHEAFTAMRARGAQATDIVVLIVAADDNVMPQTIEAIDHAKAAEVPIVVAINKIDKPNANIEMIKKQLSEHEVLIEEWGGKYQSIEISAKMGQNIDKLLESLLVESEILELKANPDRSAKGVVIESKLDKGKGVVATVLVQKGTLKIGDPFVVGQYSGKVRSMFNEFGKKQKSAGPSIPIQVTGFSGIPQAGDSLIVLKSEKDTKEISAKRQQLKREQEHRYFRHMTLDEISQQIKKGVVKELSLIIKADVGGSVEAINDALSKLSTDEVTVNIVLKGVGAISESDVLLASASNAIILGFQVRPTVKAREIAKKEKVDIRLYKVIYDAISHIHDALEGLLDPDFEEENLGAVEVREIFKVPKIGTIAGCYVINGKITRNDLIRLYREDKLIFEGHINSLKRFKDDTKEVLSGFECGIGIENYNDIKIGDIIESYKMNEVKRTLATT